MPQVPFTKQMVSLDVPAAPDESRGAGMISEATAQTSQQIFQASKAIYTQVRHAEAEAAVHDRVSREKEDINKFLFEAKNRSKGGYIYNEDGKPILSKDGSEQLTLTEYYKEWATDRYHDGQREMPSPYAQDLYRRQMSEIYQRERENVWNTEMKMRIQNIDDLRSDRLRREANKQVVAPSYSQMMDHLDSERAAIKKLQGTIYSDSDTHEYDVRLLKEVPESFFQGLENDIIAMKRSEDEGEIAQDGTRVDRIKIARDAIAVLEGKWDRKTTPGANYIAHEDRKRRGMPNVSELMDPTRKAYWLDRFNSMIDKAQRQDSNDWVQRGERMANALAHQMIGSNGAPLVNKQDIIRWYQQGVDLKTNAPDSIRDVAFVETLAEVALMHNAGPILNSWTYMHESPERKAAIIEKIEKESATEISGLISKHLPGRKQDLEIAAAAARANIRGQLQQLAERAQREFETDPAEFAMRNPKTAALAGGISYSDHRAMAGSRKSIRAFDHAVDTMYRGYTGIDGATSPRYLTNSQAEQVSSYLTGTSNSDQKTMYLLSLHGANPRTYNAKLHQLIAGGKLGPEWYVALSIKDDKVLATEMVDAITNPILDPDAILSSAGGSSEQLKQDVVKQSQTYISSIISRNSQSPITNREQEAVRNTIFNMSVKLVANGRATPAEAAGQAVEGLVNRRFAKMKVNRRFWTGVEHRPPKIVHGYELNENDLGNMERELESYYRIEAIQALNPDTDGFPLDKEKFYKQVVDTMTFRLNASQDKYIPQYLDRARSGAVPWDLTKNGKPIEIPIMDLIKYRAKNDTLMMKAGKKMGEAAGEVKKALPNIEKGAKKAVEHFQSGSRRGKYMKKADELF